MSNFKDNQPGSKYPHITRAFLQAEREAGKTVDQMAEDNQVPRGTICTMLRTYGIAGHKRGPVPGQKRGVQK